MKLQHPYSDITKEVPDDEAKDWLDAGWQKAKATADDEETPRAASRKKE